MSKPVSRFPKAEQTFASPIKRNKRRDSAAIKRLVLFIARHFPDQRPHHYEDQVKLERRLERLDLVPFAVALIRDLEVEIEGYLSKRAGEIKDEIYAEINAEIDRRGADFEEVFK